jgi:DNA-binding HxlR family transcriptional regulator
MKNTQPQQSCPLNDVVKLVGGKWKLPLLYTLMDGPHRFGELHRKIQGVTQRMLTKQLRELETAGLVERTIFAEVPPHVEYSLTPQGKDFKTALLELEKWAAALPHSV